MMMIIVVILNVAAWSWLFSDVFYPGFRNFAPVWAVLLGLVGGIITTGACVGIIEEIFHVDITGRHERSEP